MQVEGWHIPPEQTPLWQSNPCRHIWPLAHGGQTGPPQSTSVSLPFLTPSEHVGAWHAPPLQTPLEQTLPQLPQFLGSVLVLTQVPLQLVCPAGQTTIQTPLEQISPLGQALPHKPQLLLSVCRFVQT